MGFSTSVEFPSDNLELWRARPPSAQVEILVAPLPLVVDELVVEAPVPSMTMEAVVLESLTSSPSEAVEDVEVVEAFDDSAFEDAVLESVPPPAAEIPAPLESMVVGKLDAGDDDVKDAGGPFLQALKDVAIQFGATAVFAETLDSVLGREPMCVDAETGDELVQKGLATKDGDYAPLSAIVKVASAWSAAFRGEEPDFSVCTQMLDEWSAEIVTKLLGRKELAEPVRRELRSRGIAAFGLLDAA